MKITTMLSLGALGALLLGPACDSAKKDDAKPADAKPAEAKAADAGAEAEAAEAEAAEAEAAEAKAAEAEAAEAEAADDGADAELPTIGVAECDEYVTKMHACLEGDVIPEDMRDGQRTGFEMSVKSWADSAKTHPETASNLVQGCKAARDAASKQFPSCFPAE